MNSGAASSIPGDEERLYSLSTDDAAGVRQAGEDVFGLEPRIALQYGLVIVARRQHSQHVLDGQTTASNDRFAAVNPRIGRDSLKELRFVHSRSILVAEGEERYDRPRRIYCRSLGDCTPREMYENDPSAIQRRCAGTWTMRSSSSR